MPKLLEFRRVLFPSVRVIGVLYRPRVALVMRISKFPNAVYQERSRSFEALVASAIEVAALDVYEGDGAAYPVRLFTARDQPPSDRVSPCREREPVNPTSECTSSDGIEGKARI